MSAIEKLNYQAMIEDKLNEALIHYAETFCNVKWPHSDTQPFIEQIRERLDDALAEMGLFNE